jgi:suppressor of G2 allele of SKP1
VEYIHGEKSLVLEPLKGEIDPEASGHTVGKVKIEVRLAKSAPVRWASLVGDSPDRACTFFRVLALTIEQREPLTALAQIPPSGTSESARPKHKNWEGITTNILSADKDKSPDEDPNAGGDASLNSFFQTMFADADDDAKRAMMKSYSESGGTTLSMNWDEVKKGRVDVKPPEGSEWKKWGAKGT